ncbi:MAG: hypothetical protein ABI668_10990 [Sphingorhabdus sp.]
MSETKLERAGIAAMMPPIKSVAFLISFFGLLVALFLRRTTAKAA